MHGADRQDFAEISFPDDQGRLRPRRLIFSLRVRRGRSSSAITMAQQVVHCDRTVAVPPSLIVVATTDTAPAFDKKAILTTSLAEPMTSTSTPSPIALIASVRCGEMGTALPTAPP